MRRNRLFTLGIVALATLTGCSMFGKKSNPVTAGAEYPYGELTPSDPTSYPVADSFPVYGTDSPTYQPELVAEPVTRAPAVSLAAPSERVHTVVKHDTLYSIARSYYGDHHKWKVLYEANRDTIANPNMIRVGQQLVVP